MANYDDTATVSGSVVSFSDGADEVGAKSCVVTISPTLSGVSALTETHIPSRNMASVSDADFTLNNVHYYANDGIIYIDGISTSETSSNNNAFKVLDFWLPSGTYYFSRGATLTSLNVPAYVKKYDDKSQIVVNTGSFTLSEKTHLYIAFYVYQKTFSNIKAEICINLGSTAITYEDTAPMTQYSANLGRTIYGGSVDVVKGEGKDENRKFTVTSPTFDDSIRFIGSGNTAYIQINSSPASNSRWQDLACSHFTPANIYAGGTQQGIGCYSAQFYIRDSRFTSKQDFIDFLTEQETLGTPLEICYKKATSETFTFEPVEISSKLGSNTMWSEQGDTEVTYYKSGYGFTSVTVHKDTPDGEPVEETRKLHRIIYEGQVDVINGTGLIYRGESGTQYDPPEQISFTPIEVSTDEGENTLFANEGDSAITYRKDTE